MCKYCRALYQERQSPGAWTGSCLSLGSNDDETRANVPSLQPLSVSDAQLEDEQGDGHGGEARPVPATLPGAQPPL